MPLISSDFDLWISASEAPQHPNLFFVGTFDNRITLYSQQVRALQVVHALAKNGRLHDNERVAVIGGGAAGITAALATALSGCDVTLYERATGILQLQSGSPRFLHPHIYEWPRRGSLEEDAVLPFLDWSAASGGDVRTLLASNYQAAKTPGLQLHEQMGWALEALHRAGGEWSLTFRDHDGTAHERIFPIVIMAIGFGDELICGAAPRLDYWRHAGLSSNTVELEPARYFVSGNGDGGLTDALAVLISGFEHLTFTRNFLARIKSSELAEAVEAAEAVVTQPGGDLMVPYTEHVLPVLTSRGLVDHVSAQLRSDRSLVFNANPVLGKGRAARLNQVMVFALLQAAAAQPDMLRLTSGTITDVTKSAQRYQVHGAIDNGLPVTDDFDAVVLRHGPDKAKRFQPVGQPFTDFRQHHDALLGTNPNLAEPPRLDSESFDYFDALFTDRMPDPGLQNARRAESAARKDTILLSWDPAYHELVQQGPVALQDVAQDIEDLGAPLTLLLSASPATARDYFDIVQRLANASAGKLTVGITGPRHQEWQAAYPQLSGPPNFRSPYPPERVPELDDVWSALEGALLRMLERRLEATIASNECEQIGPIHPTISAAMEPTWASWRVEIDSDPEIRSDFLRLLFRVELAGKDRWDGDRGCLPNLTSALVLMLATHAEEPLVPACCSPGNLQFGTDAVGLGSGCSLVKGRPVADIEDPKAWSVDALILSQAHEEMFRTDFLLTEAGEAPRSMRRAERVTPVVIPNTRSWRKRLAQDVTTWRAAVREEFDRWRKRQEEALKEI